MQKERKLKKEEKEAKDLAKAEKRAQKAKRKKKLVSKKRKIDAGGRVSERKSRQIKVKLEPDRFNSKIAVSRVNPSTVVVQNNISVPDAVRDISNQRATFIARRVNTEEFLSSLAN